MTNSLSIASDLDKVKVFQCPNCKQTIDTSAQQCRFCSAIIDPTSAAIAAQAMASVSQACNDASYIRIAAITMVAFLGVMFIPFFGLLGVCGYYFLTLAIPVLTIRWWIKFGSIKTDDSDFPRARRTVVIISALILLPLALDILRLVDR